MKMKSSHREFVKLLGVAMLFGVFAFGMLPLFVMAYDNSETKSVTIYIDKMKEADAEALFFLPLVFIIGGIALGFCVMDYINARNLKGGVMK